MSLFLFLITMHRVVIFATVDLDTAYTPSYKAKKTSAAAQLWGSTPKFPLYIDLRPKIRKIGLKKQNIILIWLSSNIFTFSKSPVVTHHPTLPLKPPPKPLSAHTIDNKTITHTNIVRSCSPKKYKKFGTFFVACINPIYSTFTVANCTTTGTTALFCWSIIV